MGGFFFLSECPFHTNHSIQKTQTITNSTPIKWYTRGKER